MVLRTDILFYEFKNDELRRVSGLHFISDRDLRYAIIRIAPCSRLVEGMRRNSLLDLDARIRKVSWKDGFPKLSIDMDAVVFIFAAFSPGCLHCFSEIVELLNSHCEESFVFHIVDTMNFGEGFYSEYGIRQGVLGGWGESFWVRGGEIKAIHYGFRSRTDENYAQEREQLRQVCSEYFAGQKS